MCFRISSGCRADASSASWEDGNRSGCPANSTRLRCSTRQKAERELRDSAAKSVQRMQTRVKAVQCRVTAAKQLATNTQPTRPLELGISRHRILHHYVPNLSFSRKQRHAGFCSTARAMLVLFVSQAWCETGTPLPLCRFPLRPPRTRSDSRPRSMSRSQSQRRRSVWSRSHPPNSFRGASTQIFSCESTIGAIPAEGVFSGGTTSGTGPVETGRISGCSTRVAMSIAVKSRPPARK